MPTQNQIDFLQQLGTELQKAYTALSIAQDLFTDGIAGEEENSPLGNEFLDGQFNVWLTMAGSAAQEAIQSVAEQLQAAIKEKAMDDAQEILSQAHANVAAVGMGLAFGASVAGEIDELPEPTAAECAACPESAGCADRVTE